MILAFDDGEHVGDTVDISDQRFAGIQYRYPEWLLRFCRPIHLVEPAPYGIVHDILQAGVAILAQALQTGGVVGVQRERRSHTSKHQTFDALMSILKLNPTANVFALRSCFDVGEWLTPYPPIENMRFECTPIERIQGLSEVISTAL